VISLGHDQDWHDNRLTGIGGSDAKKIMIGDWHDLWLEKTKRKEGDDLSNILPVQMGSFTEAFNLYWFTKQTGLQVDTSWREQRHKEHKFMRAEIDGWAGAPVECKHVNQNTSDERVIENYYPQMQHQMAIVDSSMLYLSVLFGNVRWAYFEIARDDDYIEKLIARETEFWGYVERDEPPSNQEAEVVKISLDNMREVDMTGSNEWAFNAAAWLESQDAKKVFDIAVKDIKALIETDVKLASGHGIVARRAKNGAITIRMKK